MVGVTETKKAGYQRFAELIRTDIVSGVYPQGSRLKIPDLCSRYQTSAIPIREALQSLSGEGLVVITPNRGATVRAIDAKFVDEILLVRQVLEAFLIQRFIEIYKPDDLNKLHEFQSEMDACEDRADLSGRIQADLNFHSTIAHCVGNAEIIRIIERQSRVAGAVFSRFGQSTFRRKQVREEHRAILAAVEQQNSDKAADLMFHHVENTRREIVEAIRRETPS